MRGTEVTLSFPPFAGLVRKLILINAGIYLATLMLGVLQPPLRRELFAIFGLVPGKVFGGWIWQVVSYAFLHSGLFHLIYNMFALWMFGTELESVWGRRRFLQLYFVSLAGAALVTLGMALTGVLVSMAVPTVGASGAAYGILAAYATIFGERRIIIFPLPIPLKAKHWILFLVFLSVIGALEGGGNVAHVAHLGGLLFGYLYVVFAVRRRAGAAFGGEFLGLRNAWYRWKRRRAGKKFEVYMRQFENQPEEETDPNALPPGKKNGEHRGPWIN
ncbi:MAG: rhomboid family intramembrane serine protease [Acidobacteria bacterium]|nr:rhomboid family intramembrane serine protease [Acidobacteriota bacterium]